MSDAYERNYRLQFVYGTDMEPARMRKFGMREEFLGAACLADHALGFFAASGGGPGGIESVVEAPGGEVWGAVYKLGFGDAERLDGAWDVRLDGTGAYFLYPARVQGRDGRVFSVFLHKKDDTSRSLAPSPSRLGQIQGGAQDRGLPPLYCRVLSEWEVGPVDGPPGPGSPGNLFLGGCGGCGDLRSGHGKP
jgi:hypothetical protein